MAGIITKEVSGLQKDFIITAEDYHPGIDLCTWLRDVGPIGEELSKPFFFKLFTDLNDIHSYEISHNNLTCGAIEIDTATFKPYIGNFWKIYRMDGSFIDAMKAYFNKKEKEVKPLDDFRPSDLFQLTHIMFQTVTGADPFTYVKCHLTGRVHIQGEDLVWDKSVPFEVMSDSSQFQNYAKGLKEKDTQF